MSRIGKKPIPLLSHIRAEVSNGDIFVRGPKGEIRATIHPAIQVAIGDKEIAISPRADSLNRGTSRKSFALWGLTRSLVANMVEGVDRGFEKKLEYEGIGFRATMDAGGKAIVFQLGFSHPVRFEAPEGISFLVEKNSITVSGIRKELVGQVAAQIRALKPPEPYKGKGIRYRGEVIRRKAGKKAASG